MAAARQEAARQAGIQRLLDDLQRIGGNGVNVFDPMPGLEAARTENGFQFLASKTASFEASYEYLKELGVLMKTPPRKEITYFSKFVSFSNSNTVSIFFST